MILPTKYMILLSSLAQSGPCSGAASFARGRSYSDPRKHSAPSRGNHYEWKSSHVEAGLTCVLGSTRLHKKRAFAVCFIQNRDINSLLKGRIAFRATDSCPEVRIPSG